MKRLLRFAAVAGLALLFGTGAQVELKPPRTLDRLRQDGCLQADAAQLKDTVVTPVLEAPIGKRRNVLWCGAFQLAWNEACTLFGQDLRFAGPTPWAEALNRKTFTGNDLDPASCVALAGYVKDGIYPKIKQAMAAKFPQRPPTLPPPRGLPQEFVAYAFLSKSLAFATPFGVLDRPLRFEHERVAAFGLRQRQRDAAEMAAQVLILDYRDSDDFVIELKSRSAADRLILAKVPPGDTLAATVAQVQARSQNQTPPTANPWDVLSVPKINFDIRRRYHELEGKPLALDHSPAPAGLRLTDALQDTRFRLDEKGVELTSEAHLRGGCSAKPRSQRRLIFDEPFLVLMQQADRATPYFALWVGTPTLLVPW